MGGFYPSLDEIVRRQFVSVGFGRNGTPTLRFGRFFDEIVRRHSIFWSVSNETVS